MAFVGYTDEASGAVIELTHNWGGNSQSGNAFGHIAIEVEDAYAACENIKQRGGKRGARRRKNYETCSTVIAFVGRPGMEYKIELIQKKG